QWPHPLAEVCEALRFAGLVPGVVDRSGDECLDAASFVDPTPDEALVLGGRLHSIEVRVTLEESGPGIELVDTDRPNLPRAHCALRDESVRASATAGARFHDCASSS